MSKSNWQMLHTLRGDFAVTRPNCTFFLPRATNVVGWFYCHYCVAAVLETAQLHGLRHALALALTLKWDSMTMPSFAIVGFVTPSKQSKSKCRNM